MEAEFAERYGPWAVIAGASNGVGVEYARMLAERGVNLVLVARRQQLLDELAETLRADTGIETRTATIDLAQADAPERFLEATADIEVGTFMYCAGGDSNVGQFLDRPEAIELALVQRNCVTLMRLSRAYADAMKARGRGSIIILSSAAGEVGAAELVVYGATKAFDTVFGEGLWSELSGTGVDVLTVILGATDTEGLRKVMVERGAIGSVEDEVQIPGAVTSLQVAQETLDNLTNGPTWFAGDPVRDGAWHFRQMTRSDAVRAMYDRMHSGIMKEQS